LNFAIETSEKMKQLGITFLNISPQEILLKSKEETLRINSNKCNEVEILSTNKLSLNRRPSLSGPAIKMEKNLHHLLLNINKLPLPPPTMNPMKFENIEVYNQILLRKLERNMDFKNDDNFLEVRDVTKKLIIGSLSHILNPVKDDDYLELLNVISEVDLLNNESNFTIYKKEAIKILSCRIGKIYDKIIEEHVEEEAKRRLKLRYYVNILNIQRKIEIYCNLFRTRGKGETIKSQSMKRIIAYNPNIMLNELKKTIRAGKELKSYLNYQVTIGESSIRFLT